MHVQHVKNCQGPGQGSPGSGVLGGQTKEAVGDSSRERGVSQGIFWKKSEESRPNPRHWV